MFPHNFASCSLDRFDERHPFARASDRLRSHIWVGGFDISTPARGSLAENNAPREMQACKRQATGMRFHGVAERGADGSHREIGAAEKRQFL